MPVASSFLERLVGLIGRRDRLSLLIPRCATVHTWFMRSPIDIVFLSESAAVLAVERNARPWRVYAGPRGTKTVLELPPDAAREISPGDMVGVPGP